MRGAGDVSQAGFVKGMVGHMLDKGSGFEFAAAVLPQRLREAVRNIASDVRESAEEIRLRAGVEACILHGGGEFPLLSGYAVTPRDLESVLEIATGASAHSAMESIRRGFVTVRGGCRVGLCGSAVAGRAGIESLRRISSVNIRVPREVHGCADEVWSELSDAGLSSILIISPPGGGKTTLLREICRLASNRGFQISLVDERGEVAAVWDGQPQFDVGRRTDILTGAPKAEGIMLLLRSMNPQIIALDEITAPEDVHAIEQAANCGVRLLATAHAGDMRELMSRPLYERLMRRRIFDRVLVITREGRRRVPVIEATEI